MSNSLVINAKIKTDLLEEWRSNQTVYVCAMTAEQGGQPPSKIDCKEISFGPAYQGSAFQGCLTSEGSPVNLTIGNNTTVKQISLTTNIVSDQAVAENQLAYATVSEAFPYGGTLRISEILLEIK